MAERGESVAAPYQRQGQNQQNKQQNQQPQQLIQDLQDNNNIYT